MYDYKHIEQPVIRHTRTCNYGDEAISGSCELFSSHYKSSA